MDLGLGLAGFLTGVAAAAIVYFVVYHGDRHIETEAFGCGMVYQYERTLFSTKGFISHANDDHRASCDKIKAHAFADGLVIDDTADLQLLQPR